MKHILILAVLGCLLFASCTALRSSRTVLPIFYKDQQSLGKDLSFRACGVGSGIAVVAGNNGKVFISSQKKQKWKEFRIPGTENLEFRDVEILSKKEILLMSAGEGKASKIYRTENGGKSWECTHTNEFAKGFYNGFDFWDKKSGVLLSDPIDDKLYLLKTTDGGKTWNRLVSKQLPEVFKKEYGFAASGTSVCTFGKGELRVSTGGAVARVFSSSDYGDSWSVDETPIVQGEDSKGIFSIDCWNTKNAVVVGGDWKSESERGDNVAIFTKKNDWQLQDVDSKQLMYASCVQYLDERFSLIATGPSGTAYSTSAGEDWYYDSYVKGFHAVAYDKGSKVGLLSGSNGRIQFFSMKEDVIK